MVAMVTDLVSDSVHHVRCLEDEQTTLFYLDAAAGNVLLDRSLSSEGLTKGDAILDLKQRTQNSCEKQVVLQYL